MGRGGIVAWYETWALIGDLPADLVLLGTALGGLYFAYVVAIVALAAALTRGTLGTMFITLSLVLIPQITLGLLGGLGEWLPGSLSGALGGLTDGTQDPIDYVRSAAVSILVSIAALAAAIRLLDRREV